MLKDYGKLGVRRSSAHAGDCMPDEGSLFDDADLESPTPKSTPTFQARAVTTTPAPVLSAPEEPEQGYSPPAFKPRAEVRDFSMEEAIRAVGDLLHPEEQALYSAILNPLHDDVDLIRRVDDWRQRNDIPR